MMSLSLVRSYPLNICKSLCVRQRLLAPCRHLTLQCQWQTSTQTQSQGAQAVISSRPVSSMQYNSPTSNIIPSLQSQISGACLMQKRFYNKRKTLKIPPTKPLNFDFGGDLTTEISPLDLSLPKLEFDGADELKNADETLSKLLSVEYGDGHDKQKRRIHDLLSKVKEHPFDVRSLEVVIAYQTVAIRNQMRHVLDSRKDKAAKSLLNLRLQARRKHMRHLRSLDMEKFLWLCEELQIKFIPVPEYNRKPSKRALLKKAARDTAIQMRKEKIELMKQKLEEEKVEFINYKEQQLTEIAAQIEALNVDVDSHLGKVYRAIKHRDWELVKEKPEPNVKRRNQILQKKFEIAERIKREREAQQA